MFLLGGEEGEDSLSLHDVVVKAGAQTMLRRLWTTHGTSVSRDEERRPLCFRRGPPVLVSSEQGARMRNREVVVLLDQVHSDNSNLARKHHQHTHDNAGVRYTRAGTRGDTTARRQDTCDGTGGSWGDWDGRFHRCTEHETGGIAMG